MLILARNWKDLDGLENENYRIDVDINMGCGWIRAKDNINSDIYLTTHTFYGRNYKGCTKLLQSCGFDVELVSWDKEFDSHESN